MTLTRRLVRERLYAGQSRDARRADRRRRLIASGIELFGARGYAETSIGVLCAHSRVTARHFYELFKGRQELLQAVSDEIVEELFVAVARALAEDRVSPAARARAGLAAFVHHLLDDPRRARILCVEVVGLSPELERHRRAILHRFAALVASQAAAVASPAVLEAADVDLASLALVAGTYELVIEAVTGPQHLGADRLIDELARLYGAVAGIR